MLHFFNISSDYYKLLENFSKDIDCLIKGDRPYVLVKGLQYCGQNMALLVPARTNMEPEKVQSGYGLEINMRHGIKNGKVSGLDVSKAIPYVHSEFHIDKKYDKNLVQTAQLNTNKIKSKCQEMLNNYEKGIKPWHGLKNFDRALEIANECRQDNIKNKVLEKVEIEKVNINEYSTNDVQELDTKEKLVSGDKLNDNSKLDSSDLVGEYVRKVGDKSKLLHDIRLQIKGYLGQIKVNNFNNDGSSNENRNNNSDSSSE